MKVYKFGGASVKDAEGVKNLLSIVRQTTDDLVVVVSAMGKTTNALERIVDTIGQGDKQGVDRLWKELLSRPALSVEGLYERVQAVLDTVRKGGDQALKDYEQQFDKVQLDSLAVSQAELDEHRMRRLVVAIREATVQPEELRMVE